VFLTVSFDPQYDTPEILAEYAAEQHAGGPGWHFLTGDPAKIERVCDAFGIQYFPDEGLITHSLQTAVIDRDGRLAATVEGKEFTPTQIGDLIGSVLDRSRCRSERLHLRQVAVGVGPRLRCFRAHVPCLGALALAVERRGKTKVGAAASRFAPERLAIRFLGGRMIAERQRDVAPAFDDGTRIRR